MIEFYNEDCMAVMARYPDNHFELAIVDPPYGINVKTNMGRRAGVKNDNPVAKWDSSAPGSGYFSGLARVSKNQIIWGANHFISNMRDSFDVNTPCWLSWDKKFSHDLSFAQFELAWTSFSSVAKKFEQAPNSSGRIHPTQKPVKLYEWLLKNYAKPGDKILDTHGGSMSSAIACHYAGHDMVISELDKDYFDAARTRFDKETAQESLF